VGGSRFKLDTHRSCAFEELIRVVEQAARTGNAGLHLPPSIVFPSSVGAVPVVPPPTILAVRLFQNDPPNTPPTAGHRPKDEPPPDRSYPGLPKALHGDDDRSEILPSGRISSCSPRIMVGESAMVSGFIFLSNHESIETRNYLCRRVFSQNLHLTTC
jgi:hypothetical protein